MQHKFSLAFLTVKDIRPIEMIRVAAETGYDCVGLRLLPAGPDGPYSILNDRSEQRNVLSALSDTGIQVADAEVVRIGKSFNLEILLPFFEVCSYLGAKHVLVVGDDPDRTRLIDNYGVFWLRLRSLISQVTWNLCLGRRLRQQQRGWRY